MDFHESSRFYASASRWRRRHTRFIRTLLEKMEQGDAEVLYLSGNHEDLLEKFLPFQLGGLKIAGEYAHRAAGGRRYLNCGDWVETMSAVVEYPDGRMETLLYRDFMKRLAYAKDGAGGGAEFSSCRAAL